MSPELRGLRPDEHDAALDLWGEVFGDDSRDYFVHYFTADPDYRDDDCRVAVVDGALAAAVHICRRRMEWDGREILCGAIANVATRNQYRRQGLSRDLLRQAILRMEGEQFAFSMLFTGRYGHYGALGWELVATPRLQLTLPASQTLPEGVRLVNPTPLPPAVPRLYQTCPHRPLHLIRPDDYFAHWPGWFWRQDRGTQILLLGDEGAETGYAVLNPRGGDEAPCVNELRAVDGTAEAVLLTAAAGLARERGSETLELPFLPQFGGQQVAARVGEASPEQDSFMMLRRVTVSPEEMERIKQSYASGAAQFWRGDDF
jgi:predicted N-acetyltransferase YhbS